MGVVSVDYIEKYSVSWAAFWILASAALILLLSIVPVSVSFAATAQAEQTLEFDHLTTGYPLEGQHAFLECGQCHINGVFKGTPTNCSGCHDGGTAKGKTALHIQTEEECDVCHTTSGVLEANATMDHSTTNETCITCHNGLLTIGKSTQHIRSTELCETCHTQTTFIPALVVDHAQVLGSCSTCHNDLVAIGKSANHQPTSDLCEACHTVQGWVPPITPIDHSQTFGACSSCHNGQIATGKSPTHIQTNSECDLCHDPSSLWTAIVFDHDGIVANCAQSGCHDGSNARTKTPTHIQTTNLCEACHITTTFAVVPNVDHTEILPDDMDCTRAGCHDGSVASTPSLPTKHIQTTTNCGACHVSRISFMPIAAANVDHGEILPDDTDCTRAGCHDGQTGFTAQSPTHIPTTDVCGACHNTASFLTVASADVDHTQVIGECIVCHDGVRASGKANRHNLITTTDTCDACHAAGPATWAPVLPAAVDHNEVIGSCFSCHNGTAAGGPAGKHIAGGQTFQVPTNVTTNCDACHIAGSTWAPVAPSAVDHFEVTGACMGCHNGATGADKDVGHVATTSDCDVCHSPGAWLPASVDHNGIDISNPLSCVACHVSGGVSTFFKGGTHIASSDVCGACHTTNQFKPTLVVDHGEVTGSCISCHDGTIAIGKDVGHINSTNNCQLCHSTIVFKPVNQVDHSQVNGTCSSCHDGVIAIGVGNTHIPITQECDTCHTTAGWTPTSFDHSGIGAAICASCHDGVLAKGKTVNHIAITQDLCDSCHAFNAGGWIASATNNVDHTLVAGNCVSCHNGLTAIGKINNHIASTNVCDACHNTNAFAPVPGINVDHNEVLGSCNVCHDGVIATGKPNNHPATTNMCDACHSPGAWKPVVVVDHNEVIGTCIRCHDGTIARAKNPGHVNTSNLCERCHTTITFKPVLTVDHNEVNGSCSSCHNGTIAIGKDNNHANTTNVCDACHNTTVFRPVLNVDHTQVIGTCSACHNGTIAKGKGNGHFQYSNLECDACHTTNNWIISNTYPHNLTSQYPRPDHRFGNRNCRTCHTRGTSDIPATYQLCARCHANDYTPNDHQNAPISTLQNCAGTCHQNTPEHRADRGGW